MAGARDTDRDLRGAYRYAAADNELVVWQAFVELFDECSEDADDELYEGAGRHVQSQLIARKIA